jgi:hypothetical protein
VGGAAALSALRLLVSFAWRRSGFVFQVGSIPEVGPRHDALVGLICGLDAVLAFAAGLSPISISRTTPQSAIILVPHREATRMGVKGH